jgi:hypothetical protein
LELMAPIVQGSVRQFAQGGLQAQETQRLRLPIAMTAG